MKENKVEEKVAKPAKEKKEETVEKKQEVSVEEVKEEPKVEILEKVVEDNPPEEVDEIPSAEWDEKNPDAKPLLPGESVEKKEEIISPPKVEEEEKVEESSEESPKEAEKKTETTAVEEQTEEPKDKEPVKEEATEEFPKGGKMYLKLSDKCKHRTWTDIISSWVIYRGRKKLTPNRWSGMMKKAVREGILEVVERNPTGKINSFNPVGPKGVEVQKIDKVTSDKDTTIEKNKVIELVQKPKEIKVIVKPSEKLDEALKSKKPIEIGVKVKEAPLPKEYTETR